MEISEDEFPSRSINPGHIVAVARETCQLHSMTLGNSSIGLQNHTTMKEQLRIKLSQM
jgi:hypothetical protein